MPNNPVILQVAVNVPLSRLFDYLPASDDDVPLPGCRVTVPFGRRREVGVVLGHSSKSDFPLSRIRRISGRIDTEPLLNVADLWLIRFCSDYYHHPIGEAVSAALPAGLRQGRDLHTPRQFVAAADSAAQDDVKALQRRAPRQAELLATLLEIGPAGIEADALTARLPGWRRVAKALVDRGLVSRFESTQLADDETTTCTPVAGPVLNKDQQTALDAVRVHPHFGAFVLDGVTGSGKTEVYLQLMQDALQRKQQVLVLVPEIGLTPQLLSRLTRRLGRTPALLHSALSDSERLAAWRAARDGHADIVIGTRSAVFTPMPRLGLVIVDEEHDHSFKQAEGLRYSARDLAIARAKHHDVHIVLGSATPTLELLQHARDGNFTHLRLPQRAGGATPPAVRLIDIANETLSDGIGAGLYAAMQKHLDAGGQVLLFLNRRGFAPTLICAGCGHVAECRRCDSRMTVHAGIQELRCHHCGASRRLDTECGECGSDVRPLGEGTERIEHALLDRFRQHVVQRIDSDSTQRKGAIDAALLRAEQGDADILVGTQMLSKGHHFPKLTLVGVVNADQGLFGTDFRSAERLAQSVVQVAGRAGREDRQGEVVIQTAFANNPFWEQLIRGGYERIADQALSEREATRWPPFTRLALIRASAHQRHDAEALLRVAAARIAEHNTDAVRVLGPVDAPLARKAGRQRMQLLLQSSDRRLLHTVLRDLRPYLENAPSARKVRWSIDVDPIELF